MLKADYDVYSLGHDIGSRIGMGHGQLLAFTAESRPWHSNSES